MQNIGNPRGRRSPEFLNRAPHPWLRIMFGTKLRTWMEAHIVRSKKKKDRKGKGEKGFDSNSNSPRNHGSHRSAALHQVSVLHEGGNDDAMTEQNERENKSASTRRDDSFSRSSPPTRGFVFLFFFSSSPIRRESRFPLDFSSLSPSSCSCSCSCSCYSFSVSNEQFPILEF